MPTICVWYHSLIWHDMINLNRAVPPISCSISDEDVEIEYCHSVYYIDWQSSLCDSIIFHLTTEMKFKGCGSWKSNWVNGLFNPFGHKTIYICLHWWQYFSIGLRIGKWNNSPKIENENNILNGLCWMKIMSVELRLIRKKSNLHMHSVTQLHRTGIFWLEGGGRRRKINRKRPFKCTCPYFYDAIITHKWT